jgi:hypothetical protein
MNMVRAITSLVEGMNIVFRHDKVLKIHMPKKDYHE